jgi:tight adherence protein B
LRRVGRSSSLGHHLDAAGIHLAPGEFVVLSVSAGLVGFAIGLVLRGPLPGFFLGAVGLVVPRLILTHRMQKRRAEFADQMEGTLQLLAGSLRAGYGLVQSIATVANEAAQPTAEEFQRVVVETRLGRDLVDSLQAVADRMQSDDFRWIVQAIEIQRNVGGDLAEVLDTSANTIRERNHIRRQIRSLSAEGRYSAYVMIALPFFIAGAISLVQPDFLAPLFEETVGRVMLIVGGVLMAVGIVWVRRIIRLVF